MLGLKTKLNHSNKVKKIKKTSFTGDFYFFKKAHNTRIMNMNEKCLIKYLTFGKYEQKDVTNALISFLLKYNVKLSFCDLNPVCNIIDEMEFFDNN